MWDRDGRGIGSEHREEIEVADGIRMPAPPECSIRVEGTLPAILEANETRFLEFAGVVEAWS